MLDAAHYDIDSIVERLSIKDRGRVDAAWASGMAYLKSGPEISHLNFQRNFTEISTLDLGFHEIRN